MSEVEIQESEDLKVETLDRVNRRIRDNHNRILVKRVYKKKNKKVRKKI